MTKANIIHQIWYNETSQSALDREHDSLFDNPCFLGCLCAKATHHCFPIEEFE